LDNIAGSSYLAPSCTDQIYRANDATGQYLQTVTMSETSYDNTYVFKLVGRINQQFQRSVTLSVFFGNPLDSNTPKVWLSRWVWNSAGEAGVNTGFKNTSINYNKRLDWWHMPSSNEWFEIVLEIDGSNSSCHTYFKSASHYREDNFTCIIPSEVAPSIQISHSAPAKDRGGSPNSDFIGIYSEPPMGF